GSDSCGDGPFACPGGLTYSRFASLSAVTADRSGVHVVWNGELASGQSKIFVRNSPDGTTWSAATTIDANDRGHQYFPDVASADGVITVVFYDSRNDPAYAPTLPTGNTADGRNSGGAVDTFIARSTDGGQSWTESRVTSFSSNYNWETHGSRMVGFWGDYIYVSAVHGAVNVAWTDSRDLVPGVDPRDPGWPAVSRGTHRSPGSLQAARVPARAGRGRRSGRGGRRRPVRRPDRVGQEHRLLGAWHRRGRALDRGLAADRADGRPGGAADPAGRPRGLPPQPDDGRGTP